MQGLPGSGKSTIAETLVKEENAVRINKDLLRKMLHFDRWTGRNEDITRKVSRLLAKEMLLEGKNVIIDDTNLNPKTLESWKELATSTESKWQIKKVETGLYECILRDMLREDSVGRHVIVGMALTSGLYPIPEKGVVLCDLDGTLCAIDHRLHHVKVAEGEKKNWKAFFEEIPNDTLREDTAKLLWEYSDAGHEIFYVSARPDTYRAQTEEWLSHVKIPQGQALFMRPGHDSRPDTEVKGNMFKNFFKDMPIEAVIDDRPSVIRMWRELGLNVIDVGKQIEF